MPGGPRREKTRRRWKAGKKNHGVGKLRRWPSLIVKTEFRGGLGDEGKSRRGAESFQTELD